jgi:hypothetical protein
MLFKSLSQIFRPIWHERHALLAPTRTRTAIDKRIYQQITKHNQLGPQDLPEMVPVVTYAFLASP